MAGMGVWCMKGEEKTEGRKEEVQEWCNRGGKEEVMDMGREERNKWK